jgi:predicted lipoprotein with Yx(FWY)xxD motif
MFKPRPATALAAALLSLLCAATAAGCAPGDPTPAPLPGEPRKESASPSPGPSAEPSASPEQPGTQVALAEDAGLGPILVDTRGRTLYLFDGDTSTRSTCYADCAAAWPPLTTAGFPVAGSGVDDGLLGVGPRTDGPSQVLYKGHPLYYNAQDTQAGDAAGEQFDQWFAVDALGDKVTGG